MKSRIGGRAYLDLAFTFIFNPHRRGNSCSRGISVSWFYFFRVFPFFFLSSCWTSSPPLSFGLYKGSHGNNNNNNNNNHNNNNNNNNNVRAGSGILPDQRQLRQQALQDIELLQQQQQQQQQQQTYLFGNILPRDNAMGYQLGIPSNNLKNGTTNGNFNNNTNINGSNGDSNNNNNNNDTNDDTKLHHQHDNNNNDDNNYQDDNNNSIIGAPRPFTEMDQKFLERIQSSVKTVHNWDSDIELLKQCREVIPWDDLRNATGPYSNVMDDRLLQGNALFLQRLCRWFPKFMSWVNTPPCRVCGYKDCEMKTVRGAETQEEKDGDAKRVEVYYCPQCKANTTTFPRYNRAKKLLETRKGRCGEYSNLFGLFCRSVGFETRLVLDLTDHLWVEVRLADSWIMADGCEGVIDKPSMYEDGWGKDGLSYILGIGPDHVVDVTPRYTRRYQSEEFKDRRRSHTTSEEVGAMILKQLSDDLQQNLTDYDREELSKRLVSESVELLTCTESTQWTRQEKYGRGRISGSRQWKQSRQESGRKGRDRHREETNDHDVPGFEIETLAPPAGPTLSLLVRPNPTTRHNGIAVLNTPCAVGQADGVSVVVVDEACFGCILLSRSFLYWSEVKEFIDRLPPQRIVLMNGKCVKDETVRFNMLRLGGWNSDNNLQKGILFMGQVDAHPDWTFCSTIEDCHEEGHEVELAAPAQRSTLKLRYERRTMPQQIAGRLPDFVMPLSSQLSATEEEKRLAFTSYCSSRTASYCGYTSRPKCPVYLLDGTSYPLERLDDSYAEQESVWNTFHYLPEELVPEDDEKTLPVVPPELPKYVVPVNSGYFEKTLGRFLIGHNNRKLSTSKALHNSRLVGFYFASNYGTPCQTFTSTLVKVYSHLKKVRPKHGLEIVFLSSDRDPTSHQKAFSMMPWFSLPFDQSQLLVGNLNRSYEVRQTPYFVVLDSVSGKVIISACESRSDLNEAYEGGEQAMEHMLASWLDRTPLETRELLFRLDWSSQDHSKPHFVSIEEKDNPYLFVEPKRNNPFEAAARIKEMFDSFIAEGNDPTTAGTKALNVVAAEGGQIGPTTIPPGALNGKAMKTGPPRSVEDTVKQAFANAVNRNSRDAVIDVLTTAQSFVRDAIKEPWSPNCRTYKLSHGAADRITRAVGGLALIQSLGFDIFGSIYDFKATIPVAADLKAMDKTISGLLKDLKRWS